MGLVNLVGGGYPAMDSTMTSTVQDHPMGTIAVDSSGGQYIYARGCSTIPALYSLMVLVANSTQSSAGAPMSLVATQTSSAGTQGGPIGIVMSSAQSTSIFAWFQIYGNCLVSGDATVSANTQLFTSSVTAGNVMATTTGARIYGLTSISSGGTSAAIPAFAHFPHLQNA